MPETKADIILNKVLKDLNIEKKSPGEKFKHVYKIFPKLDNLNQEETHKDEVQEEVVIDDISIYEEFLFNSLLS